MIFASWAGKVRMALNLTQYEAVYNQKFKLALSISGKCLEAVGRRPPDMDKAFITRLRTTDINWYKEYYDEVCRMVGSIMFSSGFWHSYTIRKQNNGMLRVNHDVSIMTDSEKEENITDPDTLQLSEDESDSDGYTSEDDEPSPKSEIATPPLGESPITE